MLHCIYLAPQLYLQKGLLRIKSFIHSFIHSFIKPIDSNPHENYDTFMKIIQQAKYTHLPRKTVKFKMKKHKTPTFLLYQNNVRKTWSVIKETLQRKKSTTL